ncbi:hypothetical protein Ntsu_67680 [Nocardia sp. IFM 10818]
MRALSRDRRASNRKAISDGSANGSVSTSQKPIGGADCSEDVFKEAAALVMANMISAAISSNIPQAAGPVTELAGGAGLVAAASAVVWELEELAEPRTGTTLPEGPIPTPR